MPADATNATLFDADGDHLRAEYLRLVRRALPAAATAGGGWPIRLDHCFMRVVLDDVVGRRWTDAIDRRRGPAYRQLTDDQLRRAIAVAESMLSGGPDRARELDRQSLRFRSAPPER